MYRLIDRLIYLTLNDNYNGHSRVFTIQSMATRGPPESVLLICLFMHRVKLDLFRQGFIVKNYVVSVFSDGRLT